MLNLFPVIVGFMGSLHCLGMCGPLVLAYSIRTSGKPGQGGHDIDHLWRNGFLQHAAFHLGRMFTYGILGALSAGLFRAAEIGRFYAQMRGSMSMVGGILLLFLGLMLLRLIPVPSFLYASTFPGGAFIFKRMPSLLRSTTVRSRLVLGLAAGLMPCCLSWAMIVTSAATMEPLRGFTMMAGFALGTTPVLLFAGISASLFSFKVRFMGERFAAASILLMGFILVFKGVGIIA